MEQAITLRAITALSPVKARSPTAFTASGHTIRGQEPISGQTDTVTRAPKLLHIFGGPRPLERSQNPFVCWLDARESPAEHQNSVNFPSALGRDIDRLDTQGAHVGDGYCRTGVRSWHDRSIAGLGRWEFNFVRLAPGLV
jgi:hypothetical protein